MRSEEGYLVADPGIRLYFRKVGSGSQTVLIPNAIYLFDDFKHLARDRTLIFYDLRSRGRSECATNDATLARGIHSDVDDMEAVRRHFDLERVDVIGHSYLGMMVILYAMKHPQRVSRAVQIGPVQPHAGTQYPPHLTWVDDLMREASGRLGQLFAQAQGLAATDLCKQFWSLTHPLYVADPARAGRLAHWGFCDVPNELNFMQHWMRSIAPSLQELNLGAADFAQVAARVLTIHGRKDRQAPYGGGCDWARSLPDARLVTLENAAHAAWIDAPEAVFGAIATFLDGQWPATAARVTPPASPPYAD